MSDIEFLSMEDITNGKRNLMMMGLDKYPLPDDMRAYMSTVRIDGKIYKSVYWFTIELVNDSEFERISKLVIVKQARRHINKKTLDT